MLKQLRAGLRHAIGKFKKPFGPKNGTTFDCISDADTQ